MEKNAGSHEISVTFRHTESTPALNKHAIEKLSLCLRRYGISDGDTHIILSVEKRDHTAEVQLHSRQFEVSVKSTTEDLYSAIDRTVELVDTQLRKQKDKLVSQKHGAEKRIEP